MVDTWLSRLRGKPRVRQESQLSAWEALRVIQWWQSVARLQSFVPSYLHAGVESSSCSASHLPRGRRSLQQVRNSNSEDGLGPCLAISTPPPPPPRSLKKGVFEMISSVVHSSSARSRVVLVASQECTPRAWCCGHSELRHWAARVTAFQVLPSALLSTVRSVRP